MPVRIVKNGVILRVFGGTMRKFNRHQPRSLRFRLLLVVAGALLLAGAFVPRTHAGLTGFYNFDDILPPPTNRPVNLMSDAPTVFEQFFDARPLRRHPLRVPGYES